MYVVLDVAISEDVMWYEAEAIITHSWLVGSFSHASRCKHYPNTFSISGKTIEKLFTNGRGLVSSLPSCLDVQQGY